MKHPSKIIYILLAMFLATQFIGLTVVYLYTPGVREFQDSSGNIVNATLPYGTNPPSDLTPATSLFQMIISILIAVLLMLFLIKFKSEIILKTWFFAVTVLAIGISVNSFILGLPYSSLIALGISLPLSILKFFRRTMLSHNLTELLIYPGIAVIFVSILNLWTVIFLLVLISIYDIYAVWHAGFMQKMAKYQIEKLRLFAGFFVPYVSKEQKISIQNKKTNSKDKKIKIPIAILGGGDVVFPIIFTGVVLRTMGLIPALITLLGATAALSLLFYYSEKGKFYPAMPFISAGCFISLGLIYLISLI